MLTPLPRLILLLICAILSVVAARFDSSMLLIFALAASCFLLWDYFKADTVPLALGQLKKNNYQEAERVIDLTRSPKHLSKRNKAYYFFVQGMIAREKDLYKEAEAFLTEALSYTIKHQQYRGMALLALADLALLREDRDAARSCLLEMKGLKVHPSLLPSVRKMQDWLEV